MSFLIASVAVMIGCSHRLEIDLPANYSGKVSIFCERIGMGDLVPIQVGVDGTAPKADCPRSQETLSIVRNGQPVKPIKSPHWSTTGDGIVLGIDFEVR